MACAVSPGDASQTMPKRLTSFGPLALGFRLQPTPMGRVRKVVAARKWHSCNPPTTLGHPSVPFARFNAFKLICIQRHLTPSRKTRIRHVVGMTHPADTDTELPD